jgi:hypothetical protein
MFWIIFFSPQNFTTFCFLSQGLWYKQLNSNVFVALKSEMNENKIKTRKNDESSFVVELFFCSFFNFVLFIFEYNTLYNSK